MSKPTVRRQGAVAAILVALGIAAATPALAFDASTLRVELQGGRSYMDSRGTKAAFIESIWPESSIGSSRFTWAPDFSTGWIDGRNVAKYRYSKYDVTSNIWLLAGGARFRYGDASNWYHNFFFSFQGAGQLGRTQALSTHYEFISTLGWQWKALSLQIRHISNGSTGGPNRGETMGLVGVGYNF